MLRRLFTVLSVLSLLLCVAIGGMLAYSVFVDEWEDIRTVGAHRTYAVSHWRGTIRFQVIGPFPHDYAGSRNTAWANDPRFPSRKMGSATRSDPSN